jgi:hypothetical protein
MDRFHPDSEYLRKVFEDTQVLRKPISGFVTGYHVLPYILVAPDVEQSQRSVEIRGRIRVSPRLVLSPRHLGQTYGELFHDPEIMEKALVGRIFSFLYAARQNVQLESDDLRVIRAERDPRSQIDRAGFEKGHDYRILLRHVSRRFHQLDLAISVQAFNSFDQLWASSK